MMWENTTLLNAIGFDPEQFTLVAATASDMADLLAMANGNKQPGNESKLVHDKAYVYLKQLLDEVRACGKYLFWKNPKRLKGYQNKYWKRKNSRKKKKTL